MCPPEKIDLLFWFNRFSQSPKLELQKATVVDTKIEQFYFRTGSRIKATGSILEMKKKPYVLTDTVNRGNSGRFFDVIELGNHFIPISAERHPQI